MREWTQITVHPMVARGTPVSDKQLDGCFSKLGSYLSWKKKNTPTKGKRNLVEFLTFELSPSLS